MRCVGSGESTLLYSSIFGAYSRRLYSSPELSAAQLWDLSPLNTNQPGFTSHIDALFPPHSLYILLTLCNLIACYVVAFFFFFALLS